MPLPLLFIGIAVASGMFGVGGTVKAGFDAKNAKQIDSSIFLMKNINSPGILVECGFMSNASEAKLLQTDDHQRRLCAAIVSGYLQERMER